MNKKDNRLWAHCFAALEELRQRRMMTVAEICAGTGLNRSIWHRWRHGAEPRISTLAAIAEFLGAELLPPQVVVRRRRPVKTTEGVIND